MIGVTIGVGELYSKTAKVSADCLKVHTGLNSIILGNKEFRESGLFHPAALKLKIFDYTNEDDVFFFDADWFSVKNWDPKEYKSSEDIIACHDFVLDKDWPNQEYDLSSVEFNGIPGHKFIKEFNGEPRVDYIDNIRKFNGLKLHYSKWINTGMFIVSRKNHQNWLKKAEEIYNSKNGHHQRYFEQPSMIKAIEELKLEIGFLPRKFNVLAFKNSKWMNNTIGLHVKLTKREEFNGLIDGIEKADITPGSFNEMFIVDSKKMMQNKKVHHTAL